MFFIYLSRTGMQTLTAPLDQFTARHIESIQILTVRQIDELGSVTDSSGPSGEKIKKHTLGKECRLTPWQCFTHFPSGIFLLVENRRCNGHSTASLATGFCGRAGWRIFGSVFLGYGACNPEFHAAVQLLVFFGALVHNGFGAAVTAGQHTRRRQPVGLDEVGPDGIGAVLR